MTAPQASILNERRARTRRENVRRSRAMRYCESCEAPLGIFSYKWYLHRFVRGAAKCPVCGKPARQPVAQTREADSSGWVTAEVVSLKTGYKPATVRRLGREGHIRREAAGRGWLYRQEDVERVMRERQ